jgi:hypothetical protein
MDTNELLNQKSMRNFLLKKYAIDAALCTVILAAILILRACNFITNDVTGTLTGAAIGYAMSGIRKLHD